MAIELSWTDRDYLTRAVATEADHSLATSDPDAYRSQVAGIVDTILNRVASPQYPDTVKDVVNQYGQFSAINGPERSYRVYGSVENVPKSAVPPGLSGVVNEWVNNRIEGVPSSVGGHLNYANIGYSEGQRWLGDLDGPQYGAGNSIHNHGTAKGGQPVEAVVQGQLYNGTGVPLPPGYLPEVMTLVDLNDPSSRIANRVDAMWDAAPPIPEARSQATLARTKAMLDQPRPADMPDRVRQIREVNDTPPVPRPVTQAAAARARASEPQVQGQRQLLPTIGPTGTTRQDPVGSMPAAAELSTLQRAQPAFRTFNPGEAIDNGDGTRSTERTITWQMDDGKWVNTPTLFMTDRGVLDLSDPARESEAREAATTLMRNGQQFPTFNGLADAERAAQARSDLGGAASAAPQQAPGQGGLVGQDAAANRPVAVSAPRPVRRQAMSYAGQDVAKPAAPTPADNSIRRVAAQDPTTQAGNVAMPKDARPAIADTLVSQAEKAATRQELLDNGQSYVGQERKPTSTRATLESQPSRFAGEERAAPHVASDATDLSWPPASPSRAQLSMADQSYAGQERAPGLRPSRTQPTSQATSPADVPKYTTVTRQVPVEAKPSTTGAGAIPLGDVMHHRSRDSVPQEAAGKRDAETGKWRTITETKLNPEWSKQQQEKQQVAAPGISTTRVTPPQQQPQPKPEQELDLGQRIRTSIGLPADGLGGVIGPQVRTAIGLPANGIGGMLGDGIRNAIGLGNQASPPAAPVGTVIGRAANGGMMIQGKAGVMNTATQGSEAWRKATGTEPRYTPSGNGSFTSESGGVYYDRHLR